MMVLKAYSSKHNKKYVKKKVTKCPEPILCFETNSFLFGKHLTKKKLKFCLFWFEKCQKTPVFFGLLPLYSPNTNTCKYSLL